MVRHASNQKRWTAKRRKDHIMGVQFRGTAIHRFSDRSITLTDHCVFFLNQKDDYKVEVLEPTEAFSIHFTTYEPIETESFCIPLGNTEEFLQILEKMEGSQHSRDLDDLTAMSLLYRFAARISRLRQKTYAPRDERIVGAKDYLEQHFRDSDCLSRAAEVFGLSRRRFNDVFKQNFDVTPNRFLTHRRVEYAKQLLAAGSFSVSQIADLCGFRDIYYFSKVFKNETGLTPLQWRKKN